MGDTEEASLGGSHKREAKGKKSISSVSGGYVIYKSNPPHLFYAQNEKFFQMKPHTLKLVQALIPKHIFLIVAFFNYNVLYIFK